MADDNNYVNCDRHGRQLATIVCRHHLGDRKRLGFVENGTPPDDLQAWCNDCESFFLAEGEMTAAFRSYNDMAVVCVDCYHALKGLHSTAGTAEN